MKNTLLQHMKIMADNAIDIIQKETADFTAHVKTSYSGVDDDLVTTADVAAQDMYQTYIEKYFPNEGIIGEEDLNKPSENGRYFTIDPLDGTKAFGRRQSNGVGTMIAHVDENGAVDAAVIGDINTGELYFFGPDQVPMRRRFGVESELTKVSLHQLKNVYTILRDHPEEYPLLVQDMIIKGGLFKDINIEAGSIGTILARLWKDEVQLVVIKPGYDTPWDNTPFIGMHKQLDIVEIVLNPNTFDLEIVEPTLPKEIRKREYPVLIIRKQYVPELLVWADEWRVKNA
jgi:fructose-1,6-bisphosphatase/inositol monophosphatase family enzyme